MVPIAT